jgi:hypothetical protein
MPPPTFLPKWTILQFASVIMVFLSPLLIFSTHFASITSFPNIQFPHLTSHIQEPAPRVEVDLGYAIFSGIHNSSTNLNIFKGHVHSLFFPLPPFITFFSS